MKLLLASAICVSLTLAITVPFVTASNQEIDVDDLINKLQQWRQNYNDGYEAEVSSPLLERYQRANNHYQPRLPYRGYFFGERSHRSLDSLGEKEIVDGLQRKGPGPNPVLNGKTHPVYLSKRLDPTERNLLLYSYFANRLGPAFEKRYYNNKQMEDLYELEKRNFDEIDGSAFSPFKRQNIRH